jgi:hypothetical protein
MRRRALIGTAFLVAAAALGYVLGARDVFPFGRGTASTPLARIGLALHRDRADASLRHDVETVRAGLKPEDRGAFDLVVAVRGLENAGTGDWDRAEAICRGLRWPRCDRPALDELARRSRLSVVDRKELESALPLAVANAIWGFGSEDAVRRMARTELDRIPEADGPGRARVFLRFGIIEINPDGQAALFAQACAADARLGDHLKEAAQEEVRARFVPPGNVLPLYFGSGGHPPISGR